MLVVITCDLLRVIIIKYHQVSITEKSAFVQRLKKSGIIPLPKYKILKNIVPSIRCHMVLTLTQSMKLHDDFVGSKESEGKLSALYYCFL